MLRVCRIVHSWLGIIVFPFVIVIAFTGFYLNHPQVFHRILQYEGMSISSLDNLDSVQLNAALLNAVVSKHWPDEGVREQKKTRYRGQQMLSVEKPSGTILFPLSRSSYYFVRIGFREVLYSYDGRVVVDRVPFDLIFRHLHERGWTSTRFGTLFADTVALAMMFFGLTGLIMWSAPKIGRVYRALNRVWTERRNLVRVRIEAGTKSMSDQN
jgi:uncharacterized iron-regulated membrane protein